MKHSDNPEVLQAVAVAMEIVSSGRQQPTRAAVIAMLEDLECYSQTQVIDALRRCRKECKGFLYLKDIVDRVDDGRPGIEESWAMIEHDEARSFVWTTEMQEAYAAAAPLIAQGDPIAARMAYKEAYARVLATARAEGRPVLWQPSLGHDKSTHAAVLQDAVQKGRLALTHAQDIKPDMHLPAPTAEGRAALAHIAKLLK